MSDSVDPPRVVRTAGAILLNLNGMVGAGIFALPALLYLNIGSFAPVAILLFALPIACVAAIIAKLSTLFERSGGIQLYAETALGNFAGFQTGWLIICASTTGRAANFHVLVSYLAALFPLFEGPVARPVTIIALIAFMTLLGITGTRRSLGGIWIGTLLKFTPLVLLCLVGFGSNGFPDAISLPSFSGMESVALLIAYAFSGFGASVTAAGETRDPRTTLFRSVLFAIGGVAVFYAIVQWAYIAIDPDVGSADTPLAAAGQKLFGDWGAMMISIAAVFSIGTNQLSSFVVMPRILFGMGERRLLPAFFAHVSPRYRTPDHAILAYAGIVTIIALSGSFATLLPLLVAVEQAIFLLLLASLFLFWRNNFRGLRDAMGGVWLVIVPVASAMVLWMSAQIPALAVLSLAGLAVLGAALYWLARRAVAFERPAGAVAG